MEPIEIKMLIERQEAATNDLQIHGSNMSAEFYAIVAALLEELGEVAYRYMELLD